MSRYVKSSPHFFRPVARAMLLGLGVLLLLAALLPAPLETPADPAHSPNPAKSAWFLLWIQELVSYGTRGVYGALVLAGLLVALPWLPVKPVAEASWLPRPHRPVAVGVLLAALLVLVLTAVGLFLRGPDWRFVLPF